MEIVLLNSILHFDDNLISWVTQYGFWVYGVLFLIIFCETGLVILPFLPGDSLLFTAGTLAASSGNALNVHWLFLLLFLASILGNTVNYQIGRWVGPKIFHSEKSRLFNKKHLVEAHGFYERYGGKTIIIGRFIPIIRTFAPFVAGIGYMSYKQFHLYNIVGALLWIGGLLYVSFMFGNIPLIKDNFSYVLMIIIFFSLLPPIIAVIRRQMSAKCR